MLEILAVVFGGIGAIAAVISSIAALKAKSEVKKLTNIISINEKTSIVNSGKITRGINANVNYGNIDNGK